MAIIDEATDEIAALIRDLTQLAREPQIFDLIRQMSQLEVEQFPQFKEQMLANIQTQQQARDLAFEDAQGLAAGNFLSPEVMSRLVDPLQAGQFVSPQIKDTINQLAAEQFSIGQSNIDVDFENALERARGQALGRNVFDVNQQGQLSTPGATGFDRALEERTRQIGQLGRGTNAAALQGQLQMGLQLQQLLGGSLGEAFRQGISGPEAAQRALTPFMSLATTGFPPQLPNFTPTPIGAVLPQPSFGGVAAVGTQPTALASLGGSALTGLGQLLGGIL